MNYLNTLVNLITEHKAEVVRLQKLYKDLLDLDPTAKHREAVQKMDKLARRVGLKKPSKRAQHQNGKAIKDVIMDVGRSFKGSFMLPDLIDQILTNGFKTSSKDPGNMIGVELGQLVKKGYIKKTGKKGSYKFTVKGGER